MRLPRLKNIWTGLGLAVAALVLTGAVVSAQDAGPAPKSLAEIVQRYRAFVAPLSQLPRQEQAPAAKEFFRTIPWETIESLCFEGHPGVGADSSGTLGWVVHYRLEVEPPTGADLRRLITGATLIDDCRGPAVRYLVGRRDSLTAPAREEWAAVLWEASQAAASPLLSQRLAVGAASLGQSALLVERAMQLTQSADTTLVRRGVLLLASSSYSQAGDSLASVVERFWARQAPQLDFALGHCRPRCAEPALPTLRAIREAPNLGRRRLQAVCAIASVPRLAAARYVLDAYGDAGAVQDSTFATQGSARAHFYELWLATRIAEPHLLTWLDGGTDAERNVALELLDRALRFGPLDDDQAVVQGLAGLGDHPLFGPRAIRLGVRAAAPPNPGSPRP